MIQIKYGLWLALILITPLCALADSGGDRRTLYTAADSLQRGLSLLEQPADGFALAQAIRNKTGTDFSNLDHILVELASEYGLEARLFGDVNSRDLSELPGHAIMRVRPSLDSEHADHYLLLERLEGDQAVISTSRLTAQTVPLLDLAQLWNGELILLTSSPAELDHFTTKTAGPSRWSLGLAMMLGAGFFAISLRWISPPRRSRSFPHIVAQMLILLTLVVVGSAVYATAFAQDRVRTKRMQSEYITQTYIDFRDEQAPVTTHESHDLTKDELSDLVTQGGSLWIDARTRAEFEKAHLDGALLLDRFDASTIRLRLAGIPYDTTLIVYCADINCGRGRAASAALVKAGFTRVSHYPPGWAELKNWDQFAGGGRD